MGNLIVMFTGKMERVNKKEFFLADKVLLYIYKGIKFQTLKRVINKLTVPIIIVSCI